MVGTSTQHIEDDRWPRVLIIHLKRWLFNTNTQAFDKINDMLQFPATYKPNAHNTYSLRSIVVHIGKTHGGHYKAYTRDDRYGWLLYDYSKRPVRKTEHTVLQQCPYMLFYERM